MARNQLDPSHSVRDQSGAKGAESTRAWGNAPGSKRISCDRALKARFKPAIDIRKMNRAFSAIESSDRPESWGIAPGFE
jgi:hypothetical protein